MPLDQFSIYLDNQSMSFFPGQIVSGRIVIRANGEKKTEGLKLTFEGAATVHWTERHQVTRGTGDDRRTETETRHYSDHDNFFKFKSYLLGTGNGTVFIPSGESQYPFTFQLPPNNIPSSFVGQHGKVEYTLEATVKRAWKFDHHAKQHITVNAIVDLNNDNWAATPGVWTKSKKFCCLCCATGPLDMKIMTNGRGYCPGEIISLNVEINNLSSRKVTDLSVNLVQAVTFHAQGHSKYYQNRLEKYRRGQGVDEGESDLWRVEIHIPPVPPTRLGGCRIIDVEYTLKVEAHTSGMATNLTETCPITIGTVPIRARFQELRPASDFPAPSAPTLPFFPVGYDDLPPPQYKECFPNPPPYSMNGGGDQAAAGAPNIDTTLPSYSDYVPKYVTYGWTMDTGSPSAPPEFPVPMPMPTMPTPN